MALCPKLLYKNSPGATVIRLMRALSDKGTMFCAIDFPAKNRKTRKKRRFIKAVFADAKITKKV
jgi:hypothetical protein